MSTLKTIREALCVAQSSIAEQHRDTPAEFYPQNVQRHIDTITAMIAQIDVHRPLGADGEHGYRHTPTCGCQDVPLSTQPATDQDIDWARHELDSYSVINPTTGLPWPRWAGAEPIDPPDPQCVCGALWDSETNRCVMEEAIRAKVTRELWQRDWPLINAAEIAVRHIRCLRSLSPEARHLIEAWDRRAAMMDTGETVHPQMVTSAPPDVLHIVATGNGIFGAYLDGELALRMCGAIGGVIVHVPIVVDLRPVSP